MALRRQPGERVVRLLPLNFILVTALNCVDVNMASDKSCVVCPPRMRYFLYFEIYNHCKRQLVGISDCFVSKIVYNLYAPLQSY